MRKLGDILLDRGLINEEQLDLALSSQKNTQKYLGQILIDMNAITEDILIDVQSSILGFKVISVDTLKIHPKIIQFIPKSIAIKYRLVPIYIEPNSGKNILCMVTSEEPPDAIINKMSEKLNIPIKLFLATHSELESLLIKHYEKEVVKVNNKVNISSEENDIKKDNKKNNNLFDDDEILTGSLIEDDVENENIIKNDINNHNEESVKFIDVDEEITIDNDVKEVIPKKIPNEISLDFFDEVVEPSIKLESENNIPTLNINRQDDFKKKENKLSIKEVRNDPSTKKLNFLEAFKEDDSYIFSNAPAEYVNVEIGDDLSISNDDIEELDVDDVDLFDDVIKDKEDENNVNDDDLGVIKTPPPLSTKENKKIPIPTKIEKIKKGDPQNVDKSGFPKPRIKKFKNNDDETNPGTTQKINLKEKKASDDWLSKNKNRDIPDLDSIFGSDEVLDPLDNKKIDKIVLSQKLENISNLFIDFLKSKKIKKEKIELFSKFFNELDNNPSNIILISMFELLLIEEKPNIDILFSIILKNIKNGNS